MRRWSFAKGHGTENDFVLLQDRDAMLHVGAAEVRYICDRHAGIGADGLLRVVKARHIEDWDGDGDLWFMDYRNGDGSVAEMCGNGARVFARYLFDEGLAPLPTVTIATRDGVKEATALADGRIRVSMGPVSVGSQTVSVTTESGGAYQAMTVDVGNPHAVCFEADLESVPLRRAPSWQPRDAYPEGVNVEFVRRVADRHIAMRVYERGVGETRSCGTGTVAAAAASSVHFRADDDRYGATEPETTTYRVDVLGGVVEVELGPDQTFLTGPAVMVAHGEISLPEEL